MKRLTNLFLVLFIVIPTLTFTQSDPCAQAKIDAESDINGTLWYAAGCLGGIIGWGASYVVTPQPQATRLIGKDPQYVAAYTDCYHEAGKKIQNKKSLNGCLTSALVNIALNVALVSSASSATTY